MHFNDIYRSGLARSIVHTSRRQVDAAPSYPSLSLSLFVSSPAGRNYLQGPRVLPKNCAVISLGYLRAFFDSLVLLRLSIETAEAKNDGTVVIREVASIFTRRSIDIGITEIVRRSTVSLIDGKKRREGDEIYR